MSPQIPIEAPIHNENIGVHIENITAADEPVTSSLQVVWPFDGSSALILPTVAETKGDVKYKVETCK